MTLRLTILLLLGCSASASAQVKGAALLLPLSVPTALVTNKTSYLTWQSPEWRFAVYTGTNRSSLGSRQIIWTNAIALSPSLHYGIAAINQAGVESPLAYWPSNRIFEYWLRGYGSNLATFTNVTRMAGPFTNSPPGLMQFWGIADITVGWQ